MTTVSRASDSFLEEEDLPAVREIRFFDDQLKNELAKVIVSQPDVIEQPVWGPFSRGQGLREKFPENASLQFGDSRPSVGEWGHERYNTSFLVPRYALHRRVVAWAV